MSDLFDRIGARVESVVKQKLDGMRDDVQKRISVDVERRGGKVIRSQPGEPPRRDTRKLYASTTSEVIRAGDVVSGAVSVDTPYAQRLNNEMNRPIFGQTLANNVDAIRDAVRESILSTPAE